MPPDFYIAGTIIKSETIRPVLANPTSVVQKKSIKQDSNYHYNNKKKYFHFQHRSAFGLPAFFDCLYKQLCSFINADNNY